MKPRPVVVVQSDAFNRSRLATTIAAVVTSNTALAVMPGNVMLPAVVTGLPRDSVVNVTAIVTVNKRDLSDAVGQIPDHLMDEVNEGFGEFSGYEGGLVRARPPEMPCRGSPDVSTSNARRREHAAPRSGACGPVRR